MPMDLARFREQVQRAQKDALEQIDRVPISALVWGPNPQGADPISETRRLLRDELRSRGHYAEFSENLYDPSSPRGLFAQQVAQAEAFDIIFSIPGSYGSVAEIHDFARVPGLSHKIIAFLDRAHFSGYSNQSLIAAQTSASCTIELYDGSKLPRCVIDFAIDQVTRLQEAFYVAGRR